MSEFYDVVHGSDLRDYLKTREPELYDKLDPDGINVVDMTLLHNDDMNIRVFFLGKFINDDSPHAVIVEFPLPTYRKIVQKIEMESITPGAERKWRI